jgi:hypothetical protein
LQKLWANEGFVFTKIIFSGISEHNNVKYSTNSTQKRFYSSKDGFIDTVYVQYSNSDIGRWNAWHPNNDYYGVFSGSTPIYEGIHGVDWDEKRIYQLVYTGDTDDNLKSSVNVINDLLYIRTYVLVI